MKIINEEFEFLEISSDELNSIFQNNFPEKRTYREFSLHLNFQNFQLNGSLFRNSTILYFLVISPRHFCTIWPHFKIFRIFGGQNGKCPKSNLLFKIHTSYSWIFSNLQMVITVRVVRKLWNFDIFILCIRKQLYNQICQVIKWFCKKCSQYCKLWSFFLHCTEKSCISIKLQIPGKMGQIIR